MGIFQKTGLKEFEKKVESKVRKAGELGRQVPERIKSPLPKIIVAGAVIILIVVLMQYFPQIRESLDLTNVLKILKTWWTYPVAAVILFLILVSFKRFVKKHFSIEGEEDKIVKEVDKLLEEEKELKKEEKEVGKEIEVLVQKTLGLFRLSKERKVVKEKGKELQKALEQPFKDYKDVRKVLGIIDELLSKLPDEEIEKFAKSEAAKIYEKVMKKYGIK